ncbi:MAG: helicase-associated domain-containing protein [Anaerolineae bacterium]|nr:helicase-associated domain-containing protein [Anaerolineae bacterium]
MVSLLRTLQDSEPALLPILAARWQVKIDPKDREVAVKLIANAMLDQSRVEQMWGSISDAERGALQVIASNQGKMPESMFTRLFGEIRRMGAGQIEREQPHEHPAGTAEALFYHGLIGIAFETSNAGPRAIVYVPDDLFTILPFHKTAYEHLDEIDDEAFTDDEDQTVELTPLEQPDSIKPADTSIVDDMTTLLAHIQLYAPALADDMLDDADTLLPYLLVPERERLVFLIGLAASADTIEVQEGRVYVKRAETRRWLGATRSEQVRMLAQTWRASELYHDLWHVPGLLVERDAGTMPQYNPVPPREAAIDLLANLAPREQWWSQDAFIDAMKQHDRDFQRPNGDYDNWYIRSTHGEYLAGEESWDAVEGALLYYYLNGPFHWLGLLDVADGAARLTAYGRAFVAGRNWPNPPENPEKIALKDDGTILVPRKAARIDRFQVARVTTWVSSGDPFAYRLDGASISKAAEQGINVGHISGFLTKAAGDQPLPAPMTRLLENWRGGFSATASVEKALVLRTTSSDTLDFIYDTPALRRYLGARLGPMAVIVRADQLEDLQMALGVHGIQIDLIGF